MTTASTSSPHHACLCLGAQLVNFSGATGLHGGQGITALLINGYCKSLHISGRVSTCSREFQLSHIIPPPPSPMSLHGFSRGNLNIRDLAVPRQASFPALYSPNDCANFHSMGGDASKTWLRGRERSCARSPAHPTSVGCSVSAH